MTTVVRFIDVGQGNMTLVQLSNGTELLYDCNVSDSNEPRILNLLASVLRKRGIDIFVNSHRDADHMRGVRRIHRSFPIQQIWDCGVAGTTPDGEAYREYMELRRTVGCVTVKAMTYYDFAASRVTILHGRDNDLPDPNSQSIVIKVEHREGWTPSSVLLTGDSDAIAWRDCILRRWSADQLASSILLASHHGSITFFEQPYDRYYFVQHMQSIRPAMTVVSVGQNPHGHPDQTALGLYEQHSSGSGQGVRIFRTDRNGDIHLELQANGSWRMTPSR